MTCPLIVNRQSGRVYSKGTSLWIARCNTTTQFCRIGSIINIEGPEFTRDDIDGTELDAANADATAERAWFKRSYPGDKEITPITVTLNMNPTIYANLLDRYLADEIGLMYIQFNNKDRLGGLAYIKSIGKAIALGELVKNTLQIKPEHAWYYVPCAEYAVQNCPTTFPSVSVNPIAIDPTCGTPEPEIVSVPAMGSVEMKRCSETNQVPQAQGCSEPATPSVTDILKNQRYELTDEEYQAEVQENPDLYKDDEEKESE